MYRRQFQPAAGIIKENGHLRNAVLTDWFETVQEDYLDGFSKRFPDHSTVWAKTSVSLEYFRECEGRASVDIEVAVTDVQRASIIISCRIFQSGELCAVGKCEMESRDPVYRRVMPLSEHFRDDLEQEALGFLRMGSVPAAG